MGPLLLRRSGAGTDPGSDLSSPSYLLRDHAVPVIVVVVRVVLVAGVAGVCV